MSSNKESFGKTVGFVFIVCLVCAALVSVSAVQLKPLQTANKLLDKQTKILETAGLLELAGKDIVPTYNKYVEAKMIDLDTGEYVDGDVKMFDERRNARDPQKSEKLENDPAGINRQSNTAVVYLVKDEKGAVETVVFPVVGAGLWDLMYGYVGLKSDLNTVSKVIYSDHKETPGLGAEVMNPKWKALWPGKKIYNDNNEPVIKLVKGGAKKGDDYGVDALSGATLTSDGVTRTLQFWFGVQGYLPFIEKNRGELN
ncbi:Na(+)-translocating NADH-quinone reductase subunit C [Psychrosphaera haliotis]|uniref:Na(+)-translocating NADH-quinone reductase subunit C n=1 Tax=Psychrosphaera haliotis TaxID=555083 RepID=A0A6N8FFL3_9GAMM|nr:Na(+)-translocating NADH-quinone reductase subunit C [Psychrosphaera haliotis]MUH73051.1 Na(+)-translocating NADH-quinone reductase subunit C [Psychrosphaera haliotis]